MVSGRKGCNYKWRGNLSDSKGRLGAQIGANTGSKWAACQKTALGKKGGEGGEKNLYLVGFSKTAGEIGGENC